MTGLTTHKHDRRMRSMTQPIAAVLGTAALVIATIPPAQAQKVEAGPFANLSGTWTGGGQVRLEGGKNERISCKAYYVPRDGGAALGLSLRCASTSYTINLRANMAVTGGRVTGDWEEATFNASGTVVGRASPGTLAVAISGGGFSGSMSVSFGSATQQVSISSSGTALQGVSIRLAKG